MKDTTKNFCSLLLLYAQDSDSIIEKFLQQLKNVPTYAVCVNEPSFSSHHALQNQGKTRLQVVMFSPGFLNFLECKPDEAFTAFRHMDPTSTIAVFCCGLQEHKIMCYHMAPLNSYNSWPKFAISHMSQNGEEIPLHLLQTINDAFSIGDSSVDNIVIVPNLINNESKEVFVIFPSPLEEIGEFSVYLEGKNIKQMSLENINPYVIKFQIPDIMLENCKILCVRVQQPNRIIVNKILHILQDPTKSLDRIPSVVLRTPKKSKTSLEELLLEEQLRVLSEIARTSVASIEEENFERTLLPTEEEDVMHSLVALCKKYGLEELSLFINDPETESTVGDRNQKIENEYRKYGVDDKEILNANAFTGRDSSLLHENMYLNDDDAYNLKQRSLSLPSLLPPSDEFSGPYGEYMKMVVGEKRKVCFLQNTEDTADDDDLSGSLTSNGYVYMKWNRDSVNSLDLFKRGLSESQQELLDIMLAFKHGEKAISDVEIQFQSWQRRHGLPVLSKDHQQIVNGASSKWKSLIRKKSKIKDSKVGKMDKKMSGTDELNKRKISNESGSSSSSKVSEISTSTIAARRTGGGHKQSVSTGWIPTYSTAVMCPLHPEIKPPPLPPRKPSITQPQTVEVGTSLRKRLSRTLSYSHYELYNSDENERLHTLVEFCDKNGLDQLGDFFLKDLNSVSNKNQEINLGSSMEETWLPMDNRTVDSKKYLHANDWDTENSIPSIMQRSLSLPSTLYPTENLKNTDTEEKYIEEGPQFHERSKCNQTADCECRDCVYGWTSIRNNIYVPGNTQEDWSQGPLKNALSSSQQELLDMIHAFKRGHKTITQVEHQMKEWNKLHMESSSFRERELLRLRNEYEKAQKTNTFGLQGIKNFILGKPKRKESKPSVGDNIKSYVRQRNGKSESDTRRLSKISFTSTSSGVSETSEVFPTKCFFNPEYGLYQSECPEYLASFKPSSQLQKVSPPQPVVRPPPLPDLARLPTRLQKSSSFDHDDKKKSTGQEVATPKSPTKKPSPPPKPKNLLQKVNDNSITQEENANDYPGVHDSRPESPDYVTPNAVRRMYMQSNKKTLPYQVKGQNFLSPPNCSSAPPRTLQNNEKDGEICIPITCPIPSTPSAGKTQAPKLDSNPKSATQKRQFFKIANQLMKSKKKEESMFYVASRRWSSVPDLKTTIVANEPIYMQILPDRRSKSISDSESVNS